VSTIDTDTDIEGDDGDSEPPVLEVYAAYKQLKLEHAAQRDILQQSEQLTADLRDRCNSQSRELNRVESSYARATDEVQSLTD